MSTKVDVIDATLQKTISLLNDICVEFGWPEERRFQAYKALRTVLHEIRDRLPITESAHLAAQLPMLVRGLYYEGWKPEEVPRKFHREELLQKVQRDLQFSADGGPERIVDGIIHVLSRHIEPSILKRIEQEFPPDLRSLFRRTA